MASLKTKRVYDPAQAEDGFRLLVMRRWPRGIRKDHVSAWERDLGPSNELLDAYLREKVSWPRFAQHYRAEMSAQESLLAELAKRAASETVTLLCGCRDEDRCHRKVLKELLEQRRARP